MNNFAKRIVVSIGLLASLILESSCVLAAVPEVTIATKPLFSGRGNVHPNMLLNLSVEFPTVGAAYRNADDYKKVTEYMGYFNPLKCYTYPVATTDIYTKVEPGINIKTTSDKNSIPLYANIADAKSGQNIIGYLNGIGAPIRKTDGTEIISVATFSANDMNQDPTGNAYFSISKAADTNHECGGDSFSGNFMNWATSSAIDMLRYAMTGGDRTTDTVDTTVLQRAFLYSTFYNSWNFPRRIVKASGAMSAPNKVTPFNKTRIYITSCDNKVYFSDNSDANNTCASPGTNNNLGQYLVRVKVCDSNEGSTRTDLCKKYGNNYKPVGEMQNNADKIRFAAMGYLMDNSEARYGGVLRAPMKYVGPKKFQSPSFAEIGNDKPEWDVSTGMFYNNPEDPDNRTSTTVNSGVINYLNKFGRSGVYKTYDTLSELYYEGIRYLQGKGPTPEAISDMTTVMKDGFPVITTWADTDPIYDPIIASCQNNYIFSISDANTHYDRYIPGNTRVRYSDSARAADVATTKWPALDVMDWTQKVGLMEVDTANTFGNLAKRSDLANLDTQDTGSGDHGTYYMAGLAYWANTNDIRLDKPARVKTFVVDVDEGGNGEISDALSTGRSPKPRSTQMYLAAKYGGFNDKNKDGNPFKTFAADDATVVNNNSEWATDGVNPDNYFLASDPKKMINSIKNIFQVVASNSGTISGVTLTSTKISTDSAFVYQPGFDPSKWSGNLLKLKLQLVNDVVTIQDAKFPTWDAGLILTGKAATTTPVAAAVAANPTPDNRKIYTSKVKLDGSLITVPFSWSGGLTNDQKTLIDNSPVTPFASDGLGEKRVNYLRGSRTDEIGQADGIFRQRDRVLGDIINSNPTYVGAPASNLQGDDYKTFYDAKKDRTKAVYVGSNDGMLHAFNAADGAELFAYVPNAVMPGLNKLTDPKYVHQPYVDGTLTVREARVDGSWKTILASGMGGGAQGTFVLDVTNPADFASGTGAIWEFTDKDDVDMGNLTSPPQVAKFRTGVDATTKAPVYKYFVVIPSGLNNYKDDGNSNFGKTDAAEGALFLLSLDKKPADAWNLGTNYYKFKTPVKDSTLQNGLSSPALVLGNDGAVRYAYAGDLQGNMWRFDFTGDTPWTNAKSSSTPLFTAKDKDGVLQPITGQPSVITAPGGGYVVLFGTGKYVEDADAAAGNFKTQSFYGIYDTTYNADVVTARTQLEARTLTKDATAGSDAVTIAGNNFSYGDKSPFKKGWYFDFLNSGTVTGTGERSVTNPLIAYGRLFFNSLVTGSDPCATGGGRTYSLSALTGLPLNADGVSTSGVVTGETSTVGMLSSPVLFETGTTVGDRDSIGKRAVKKKFSVFNFGTGGKAGTAATAANGTGIFQPPAGRMSWREILNWQELHSDAKK